MSNRVSACALDSALATVLRVSSDAALFDCREEVSGGSGKAGTSN
jgi:hypothetical protein